MPSYRIAVPQNVTDAGRVDAFLRGLGYVLGDGVTVGNGVAIFDADRDPTADFANYTDAPTPAQQITAAAVATLHAYLTTVRAIAPALRTPEQKALLAVSVLVHDLAAAG